MTFTGKLTTKAILKEELPGTVWQVNTSGGRKELENVKFPTVKHVCWYFSFRQNPSPHHKVGRKQCLNTDPVCLKYLSGMSHLNMGGVRELGDFTNTFL